MIKSLTCDCNNTLLEVMHIINENGMGVCFVTDEVDSLKGVVTDGDIRRAILNHKSLDSLIVSILNENFVCGHIDDSNDKLIEKINEKINEDIDINIIPIVDQHNQLVDYFRYSHQSHFPVAIPNLGGNEFKYLTDAFLSTWISSSGDYIDKFEDQFSSYSDCEYGISVANGTAALHVSLVALDIGEGDEVIIPDLTFAATINAVLHANATPVIVDIDLTSWCIDPKEIEKSITSKTKAIIPVDLYGNVADIDYLKRFNLPIVQDSAQSTGAIYKGKRVGGISHLTCFSFYPTKNLGCWGDAGAVTGDVRYCDTIRQLRNHGQTSKFDIKQVGWNSRMDSIQAEVLLNKLPLLDKHNKRRREIAFMYNEALQDIVTIPYQNKNSSHVFHQYVIQSIHREKIQEALHNKKIQSRAYYPIPLNEILPYRTEQKFVNSQHASLTGLAIPVHQYLTTKEIKLIIETIKKVL